MKRRVLIRVKIVLIFLFLSIFLSKAYAEVLNRSPSGQLSKLTVTTPVPPAHKASDLSIEKIYLKECRIHVSIKNIGSAGISDEDYQSGELLVLVKKPDGTFEKN